MRHLACPNADCVNRGTPYHDHEPDEVIVLCPVCGTAMQVIPAPDPALPEPNEGGE